MPVTELFISEYVEGGYWNKAIEIYNGTGAPVNLGAGGYAVDIYFNGSTLPGTTIQLSGTLADGDVYIIADDDAEIAEITQGHPFSFTIAVILPDFQCL